MKSTTNKKKNVKKEKHDNPNVVDSIYLDDSVKDYSFYDYVRVRTGPKGTFLSFGKEHPDSEKRIIFKEILLPLDVAYRFKEILVNQFDTLEKNGKIKIERVNSNHSEVSNEKS